MTDHLSVMRDWATTLPIEADRDKAYQLLEMLPACGVTVTQVIPTDLSCRFNAKYAGVPVYGRLYVNRHPGIRIGLTVKRLGKPVLVYTHALVINRLLDVAVGGAL